MTFCIALAATELFVGHQKHIMKCKLCNLNKELKNSHIISEAFYSGIYDSKHRALPIQLESSNLDLIQKGIREKLLCAECEVKISKWEGVLKRDLVDIGNLESNFLEIKKLNKGFIKIEKIRYNEFKLAVLSILWRMSISSHDYFKSYNLGPYDEKLRTILLNEAAPKEKQYPITVTRYELEDRFFSEILFCFPPGKFNKYFTTQKFILWGHCFTIFVNDRKFPSVNVNVFLRESGVLYIDIRSLVDLASPNSVLSRLFDGDVEKMFTEKMNWKD